MTLRLRASYDPQCVEKWPTLRQPMWERMDHVETGSPAAVQAEQTLARLPRLKAPVFFEGKKLATPIYSRDALKPGKHYSGPAIVTEYSATTVIPPRKRFHFDSAANLIVTIR